MIRLSYESYFKVPVSHLFKWHDTQAAFLRLNPSYEPVKLLSSTNGIKDGSIVTIKIPPPFYLPSFLSIPWVLTHKNYLLNQQFEDHQLSGPFASWQHKHLFSSVDENSSKLNDNIEFSLPFSVVTEPLLGWFFKAKLDRLFTYRHRITKYDLEVITKYQNAFDRPQKIVISGASGLVGQSLVGFLKLAGHQVLKLDRKNNSDTDSIFWDPYSKKIDKIKLEGADHFIHLAGENVGQRWNEKVKKKILSSRVETTNFLVEVIKSLTDKPKTFICASASGYYGTDQTAPQKESDPKGLGFLSDVVEAWESATSPLKEIGIRVCNARISVVLSPDGGALSKLLPPFLLGVGGPVGSEKNYMSCIAKDDLVYALYHLIANKNIVGPVNMAMPGVAPTNMEFSRALAKALRRPCLFPVPPFILKLVFGEMAEQTILSSTNISANKLVDSGFEFKYPTLVDALGGCLGR